MGTCRYCNQSAGFLRRQHSQCRDLHAEGIREMTQTPPRKTPDTEGTPGKTPGRGETRMTINTTQHFPVDHLLQCG
jgi:hypothetical protein